MRTTLTLLLTAVLAIAISSPTATSQVITDPIGVKCDDVWAVPDNCDRICAGGYCPDIDLECSVYEDTDLQGDPWMRGRIFIPRVVWPFCYRMGDSGDPLLDFDCKIVPISPPKSVNCGSWRTATAIYDPDLEEWVCFEPETYNWPLSITDPTLGQVQMDRPFDCHYLFQDAPHASSP